VSKELTRQRVEAWKTRWITKVMHWQAEMQTTSIEEMPGVGDETGLEIMDALIQEISDSSQRDDAEFSKQAMADGLLSALLDIARTPDVAALLPDSVAPTLLRLEKEMQEP
jgi:hypothetical protein